MSPVEEGYRKNENNICCLNCYYKLDQDKTMPSKDVKVDNSNDYCGDLYKDIDIRIYRLGSYLIPDHIFYYIEQTLISLVNQ